MYVFQWNGESDVGDDSLGSRRGDARRCPCGLSLAEPPDGEINERRHEVDDDQRHGARTEVEDASFACATDSGSQIFCGGYGDGGRSRGAFNNEDLG